YWYNITPSNITVDDVWGIDPATGKSRKRVGKNEQELTVLNFVYNPTDRGQYNYNLGYTPSAESWGGMMKVLSSSASNLVEENVEYIEFWANLWDVPQGAKIYIDIGKISEDVIPDENPKPNSEDKNGNVLIDEGEDVGMDGVPDVNEGNGAYDPVNNPDPANDNFSFTYGSGDYRRINRTEGNFQLTDAGGRIPDTEDLNLNGTTDFSNNYFRYEIPLDIDPADPFKHPYVVGGGYSRPNSPLSSPFYQFRIPLKDFKQKVGDPSLSFVEYLRVWVNGLTDTMRLRITEFNLVGNQWQKIYPKVAGIEDKNDSVMALSVVSIEDNSPIYYSPPGVERERDRSQTDEEVLRNEQSLELKINNLKDGQHREAVKYLNSSLDVFNYKEMKFFIHGDESATIDTNLAYYVSESDYSSEVYFRFGADTNNYYEYRQPIKPDWNEVRVIFEKLTALKQKSDSIPRDYVPEIPGAYFEVKGKPALTRISLFVIGIVNPKNFGTDKPVGGSLWINELRVLGANDTPGWAYTGSGTLKVADLMTVSANISRTDPYFHKLADRFGSRTDAKSWGANLDIDVLKLLPFKMKESNLRLNYARSESVSDPLYVPGTDIKVDQAAKEIEAQMLRDGASAAEASAAAKRYKVEAQSVNVSNTFTLSQIKLRLPSDYWLIRDSFNSLIFSFSYNNTKGRNPSVVKTESWTWSASVTHSVTLSNDYFFYPADIPVLGSFIEIFSDYRNVKLFYTPQSINSGIQANRRYGYSLLRQTSNTTSTKPSVTRDFTASRNASFSWKLTDGGFLNPSLTYSASANSSLLFLLTENDIERSESDIWKDIFTGTLFGRDYQYSQSVDIKTNPKLPSLWNISRYITLNGGYRVNYSWSNNFVQDVLGRSAMYQNNISTGLTIKLKSLFEPLFKDINTTSTGKATGEPSGRGTRNTGNAGNRTTAAVSDTTKPAAISDSTASKSLGLQRAYLLLKGVFHWALI
ncbi:MAG TPA: cell surface protein SprA, partial [Ignavibacteriales bacterium]|nr:cell surface protein SprA [Ignavibacteriales bacterium]